MSYHPYQFHHLPKNTNLFMTVVDDQFEKGKVQMFKKGGLNFLEKGFFVNIITADVWEMQ